MSAAGRFWLSLAFASIRLIRSSTPTIARSCPATNAGGASSTAHGRGSAGLVLLGEPPDQPAQPLDVVVDDELAVDVRRHVVPGRDDATVLRLRGVPLRA